MKTTYYSCGRSCQQCTKGSTLLVAGEPKCRSEKLYGRLSPYFLAHNLYFDLRLGTSSPQHLSAPANRKLSWIAELAWQHVSAFREASVTFFTEPQLREWAVPGIQAEGLLPHVDP